MISTHFHKQEQIIYLKAQRERKRFRQKQTTILIKEAWRSKDGGCGVFLCNSKEKNDFYKEEQKIFLKALVRERFIFQNKQPFKEIDLQISERLAASVSFSVLKEKR